MSGIGGDAGFTVGPDTGAGEQDERRARALLAIICDVADAQVHDRIERCGAAQTAAEILDGASNVRRAASYRARLPERGADAAVDAAMAELADVGGRLLVPGDNEWPELIDDLGARRPYALWVRGPFRLSELARDSSVALVGARAATAYGEHVAADLAADLASHGWVVVSGGAYGIDAAAHRGAVVAGGSTVAVLANGVDEVYPKGNADLLARIAREGAVVSELPPGRHPTRQGFLARNRIIAALSGGTVVVEAALRSGSASTVTRAVELGREVMAVPGPVTSPTSVGSHSLLRDGATLVTCASEVIEAVAGVGAAPGEPPVAPSTSRDRLSQEQRDLLDAFPARRAIDAHTLAVNAGIDATHVGRALGVLMVDGWVHQVAEGWHLTQQARGT